jgi:hypothetical protein
MVAPVPTPQYINYIDNILPLIGEDKISVGTGPNDIPLAEANSLIALGESLALEDLSPYYVTIPELITTTGGDWTTLPNFTYTTIYNMMVYQAALQLIGNFIARNTDEEGRTLSYFQNLYTAEYNKILNRILDRLPNGGYRYQLFGLKPLNTGIPRTYKTYSRAGNLGAQNYTGNQLTNPQRNFMGGWGRWRGGCCD